MAPIDQLIFAARTAILQLERREAAVLAERYARLGAQLADLAGKLATAIAAAGPDADTDWLARQDLDLSNEVTEALIAAQAPAGGRIRPAPAVAPARH